MKKEYSLIWTTFKAGSDLGQHLGAENDFSLPYFVDGADKENFEKGLLNNFAEIHLLRGLLIGYFDNPPTIDTKYSKTLFPRIIEDLKSHFNFETTEQLILDTVSFIRQENGDKASHVGLMTGLEIIPNNSKIRFDLCVDLYNMLESNEYENIDQGLRLLEDSIEAIDTNEIRPDFIEYINQFKDFIAKQKPLDKTKLFNYINDNNRVCPQPQIWNKLWEMLKDKERIGVAGWNPPVPLILVAWWETSDSAKKQRLLDHIEWAENKGQLDEIANFIYELREDQWYHVGD